MESALRGIRQAGSSLPLGRALSMRNSLLTDDDEEDVVKAGCN